jgi:hypothetical protein
MEAIHNLINEAAHRLETGNIDGAKTLLASADELAHGQASENRETKRLPSRFGIGDKVKAVFNDAGHVGQAEVIKVHFTESKVFYDLAVLFHYAKPSEEGQPVEYQEDMTGSTRLYNVDSAFVHPAA